MTQWLKATVALVEDSVSSTYTVAHNYLIPSSDLHGHQASTWYIYQHASQLLIHIKKINL